MKNPIIVSAIVGTALSLSAFATPVVASSSASVKVHYKDLDLTNTAGARELRARVSKAASKVCADESSTECVRGAIAGAEPQVAVALNGASRSRPDSIAVSAQ